MSETAKPLTSFLIEDILSIQENTRLNDKCSTHKTEICSQRNAQPAELSETSFGARKGEPNKCLLRSYSRPRGQVILHFYNQLSNHISL